MSKEEVAAYRARQKAAGLVQATIWVKPEGKVALQNLADQINSGKAPLPGAGPATQTPTPTTTPNPFSLDLTTKSWRALAPYLRPKQVEFLEHKETKSLLTVPSHRPITEGLFGPQMTIMWYPAPMVYQAITFCYENFMEYYESMKIKLHLAEPNTWRDAILQVGVRPHIAPVPLPNHLYVPPEGAELPDPPDSWYKELGLKTPKTSSKQPSPVPETTHIVNTQPTPTQIVPEPWGDIELPVFS